MVKGLLLGNGMNARLNINNLSVACIGERFGANISAYSGIIQNVFGIQIKEAFLIELDNVSKMTGIETLAGILYRYIRESKKGNWSDNDEYRLQDVITCICITSIFYLENGKINTSYDSTLLPQMRAYNYIYTLNYYEFWDQENKCIHLHGKVDLPGLSNEKNGMLISKDRLRLKAYAEAIESIRKTKNIIEFSPNEVVFAPEGVEKNKLVCVAGVLPSNKLFLSEDLFGYKSKELYTELHNVDELDVFGMSPYGDKSIIDEINKLERVRVYIHNMDKNNETKAWREKLTCQYELLDSKDMK